MKKLHLTFTTILLMIVLTACSGGQVDFLHDTANIKIHYEDFTQIIAIINL